MAIRSAKFYLFDTPVALFGAEFSPKHHPPDYPLDAYDPGLKLGRASKYYQDSLLDSLTLHDENGKPVLNRDPGGVYSGSHEGQYVEGDLDPRFQLICRKLPSARFTGKRLHEFRVGRWSDLSDKAKMDCYQTFCKYNSKGYDEYFETKSMSLAYEALRPEKLLIDAQAKFTALFALCSVQSLSTSHTVIESAIAIGLQCAELYQGVMISDHKSVVEKLLSLENVGSTMAVIHRAITTVDRLIRLPGTVGRGNYKGKPLEQYSIVREACRLSWLDGDGPVSEAMMNLAMGMSSKMVLQDVRDALDDAYDQEDHDAMDKLEDQEEELLKFTKVMDNLGRKVVSTNINGAGKVLATAEGVCIVQDGTWVCLSLKDLGSLKELLEEHLSSVVDLCLEYGFRAANRYHQAILGLWGTMSASSADSCAYFSACQRDFELDTRGLTTKAFDTHGNLVTLRQCHAAAMKNDQTSADALYRYMEAKPKGVDAYHWSRSARCVPLMHFSIPLVASETKRVHSMSFQCEPEALQRLKTCIKFVMGSAHQGVYGAAPAGFTEAVQSTSEFPTITEVLDSVERWDCTGAGPYDGGAACVRDKSNVPAREDILKSAEDWNSAGPRLRREILYFLDHDWKREAEQAMQKLRKPKGWKIKKEDTQKPESKEAGRSVSSERSDVRKANSVMSNNVMPYANQIEGSLMAASPHKIDRTVAKLADTSCRYASRGYVTLLLATDFVKFGHSLNKELQQAVHDVIGQYFNQDWMTGFPEMLTQQEIVSVNGQHHSSFMNTTGGDGQGMRNAVWEVMLAAALVFVHDELSKEGFDFSSSELYGLLFFMDDHLFKLIFRGVRKPDGTPDADTLRKCRRWEAAITRAYQKLGFGMNMDKNSRSLTSAILIGMHVSTRGREHVPGRAMQRLLASPSHRCPALPDMTSSVVSAVSSAISDGLDRNSGMAAMFFGCALRMTTVKPARDPSSAAAYAIRLCAPMPAGGLGMPADGVIVTNSGVNRFDDFLSALYLTCLKGGVLSKVARQYLCQLDSDGNLSSVCRNPMIAHNSLVPAPTSALFQVLEECSSLYADLVRKHRVSEHRTHLAKVMEALERSYTQVPMTFVEGLVGSHPATIAMAEVTKIANSGTCQSLMTREELMRARRLTRFRDMNYLDKITKVQRNTVLDVGTFAQFIEKYGRACRTIDLPMPPRGARKFLVLETTDPDEDIVVSRLKPGQPYARQSYKEGKGSACRVSHLWQDPSRSAVCGAVDCLVAARSSRNGELAAALCKSLYGEAATEGLALDDTVQAPFRDLKVVQYARQCGGGGIRADLRKRFSKVTRDLAIRTMMNREGRTHLMHSASLAVAEATGTGRYDFSILAMWSEPEFVYSEEGPATRVPPVADRVTARTLLQEVNDMAMDVPTMDEADRNVAPARVLSQIIREAKLSIGMSVVARAIPTAPTEAMTKEFAFAVSLIKQVQPKKQVDCLLQIIGWRILERVAHLAEDERDLVWDHLETAGRGMRNYATGDITKAGTLLVATRQECNHAAQLAEAAGILDPYYGALARILMAAAGPQTGAKYWDNPDMLAALCKKAHVFWSVFLYRQAGHLCSMEVPYEEQRAYSLSARTWAERHKRTYCEAAKLVSVAKEAGADVEDHAFKMALALTLAYEAKSRMMDSLAASAERSEAPETAWAKALDAVWLVYARMVAKRAAAESVHFQMSIVELSKLADPVSKRRAEQSASAVLGSLVMVARDLGLSVDPHGKGGKLQNLSRVVGVTSHYYAAEAVGTTQQPAVVLNRADAERRKQSPRDWLYKTPEHFDPAGLVWADCEREMAAAVSRKLKASSIRGSSYTPRYKTRSKVQVLRGTEVHDRHRYGSETHQVTRHGAESVKPPSTMDSRVGYDLFRIDEDLAGGEHDTLETRIYTPSVATYAEEQGEVLELKPPASVVSPITEPELPPVQSTEVVPQVSAVAEVASMETQTATVGAAQLPAASKKKGKKKKKMLGFAKISDKLQAAEDWKDD